MRFVGETFGATVALGCAATVPERSAGVVAFSPALLEPGRRSTSWPTDESGARAVALREAVRRRTLDDRSKGASAEQAEARLVPVLRSPRTACSRPTPPRCWRRCPRPCVRRADR